MPGKYQPIHRWLLTQTASSVTCSFAEIERIIGDRLPLSARQYAAWWSNHRGRHVQGYAWLDAGWRTINLDLSGECITFERA